MLFSTVDFLPVVRTSAFKASLNSLHCVLFRLACLGEGKYRLSNNNFQERFIVCRPLVVEQVIDAMQSDYDFAEVSLNLCFELLIFFS